MDDNITGKRRQVMRWRIERSEGWRGRRGEVVRRRMERNEGDEGGRGSEEEDGEEG